MELDLPFYAVQRLANGRWLIRIQLGDPLLPPVNVVAVVGEQTGSSALPQPAKLDSRVDTGGPRAMLAGRPPATQKRLNYICSSICLVPCAALV
jgi:hypothetical protein